MEILRNPKLVRDVCSEIEGVAGIAKITALCDRQGISSDREINAWVLLGHF